MRILCLDSATEAATCAVIEDEKLLGEITFNYKKQHSVILMTMIDSLLKNINADISSIDGFAVSKGPGSFTGLRIGMATVKGLSEGCQKPMVAISTLDALANNMAYTDGIICPILNALRGNVYTALYTFNGTKLERLSDYNVISINELIELLKAQNKPICFIGDAVSIFKQQILENIAKVSFAPAHLNVVKAASLGELSLAAFLNENIDDIYSAAPIYIRKSQAEREYEKRTGRDINA